MVIIDESMGVSQLLGRGARARAAAPKCTPIVSVIVISSRISAKF